MSGTEDIDRMAPRADGVWMAFLGALAIVLLALAFRGFLISPSVGIPDVLLTDGTRQLVIGEATRIDAAGPHLAGKGWGVFTHTMRCLIDLAAVAAFAGFIYGMAQRKPAVVRLSGIYLLLTQALCVLSAGPLPISFTLIHEPAAIELATAEKLFGSYRDVTPETKDWQLLMHAQAAYIQGDRVAAKRLSRKLRPDHDLMEGEYNYRLQFLQGRPIASSNICFRFGCPPPEQIEQFRLAANLAVFFGVLAALALGSVFAIMRARMARIDDLRARLAKAPGGPVRC
jgi:hypothetical protein